MRIRASVPSAYAGTVVACVGGDRVSSTGVPLPSLDELRAVTQPASVMGRRNGEHWVSKVYARRLSVRITRLLVGTPVSADTVTVAMVAIGFASGWALLLPGVAGAIVCALGIQLYLVLDCVDGEIARWRRTTSARGEYLDRLGHYVVEATLLAVFGWRVGDSISSGWTSVGLLAALLAVITKAETDLVAATMRRSGTELAAEHLAAPRASRVRRLRAIAQSVKLHRITGAVEASLLVLVAAIMSAIGVDDAEQWLMLALVGIAALLAIAHAISILSSSRLDPQA